MRTTPLLTPPALAAAFLVTCLTQSLAGTPLFDSTSNLTNSSNALVEPGANGGTNVGLSLTVSPITPQGTYAGFFSFTDFSIAGGLPEVMSTPEENNGFVEMTARSLPGNTADAVVRATVIEFNPATPDTDPGNPGGTVQLREIYLYDFVAGDFSDSGFTTLTAPVQEFSQMTLFAEIRDANDALVGDFFAGVFFPNDGSGFAPNFDTLPIAVTGFQTPTSNGADDGDNDGPVRLEVLSLELQPVPEPSAAVLVVVCAACVAGRRR